MNDFYQYVKGEINKLPCSSSYSGLESYNISETDFEKYMSSEKYAMTFINFQKKVQVIDNIIDDTLDECDDSIISHYKINNQIYLEYIFNRYKTEDEYKLTSIISYSSDVNSKELIIFDNKLEEFINKNKK